MCSHDDSDNITDFQISLFVTLVGHYWVDKDILRTINALPMEEIYYSGVNIQGMTISPTMKILSVFVIIGVLLKTESRRLEKGDARIVNGKPINIEDYPFLMPRNYNRRTEVMSFMSEDLRNAMRMRCRQYDRGDKLEK
nr:unnamed protein product [Callosobruchus analis]